MPIILAAMAAGWYFECLSMVIALLGALLAAGALIELRRRSMAELEASGAMLGWAIGYAIGSIIMATNQSLSNSVRTLLFLPLVDYREEVD